MAFPRSNSVSGTITPLSLTERVNLALTRLPDNAGRADFVKTVTRILGRLSGMTLSRLLVGGHPAGLVFYCEPADWFTHNVPRFSMETAANGEITYTQYGPRQVTITEEAFVEGLRTTPDFQ